MNPNDGPVQAFAHDLRELRAAAGNPTYRAMASRTGRSKEALADASRGVRLVSWETVDAYVLACGANPRDWHDRYLRVQSDLEPAGADEPDEPAGSGERVEPRSRTPLLLLAAGLVLCLSGVVGWVLRPASSEVAPGATSARLGARPQPVLFTDGDCDHWWPPAGERNAGWEYRACIRPDPAAPSRWRAGAQVRNLRPETAHVEVYVDWESVPAAGGGNQSLGHESIQTGPVPPGAVRQVVGPALVHPGAGNCVWAEIAPLVQPQQRWSDSPRFDPDVHECRF